MTEPTTPRALVRAWEKQRIWSLAATRLKRRLDRSRTMALVLTLTTAALSVTAAQLSGPASWIGPAMGAAAAIAAGTATILQRGASTEQIRIWTRARSASEGLKTEIYTYLAGGSSYANSVNRDQLLRERTQALTDLVVDIERYTMGIIADGKLLPPISGVEDYLAQRVEDQIQGYYRPKAATCERRVGILRGVTTVLGLATVVLAAVAGMAAAAPFHGLQPLAAWAPVATTAATAVTAHITAARYEYLVIEYLRTARQLEHLRDAYLDNPGSAAELIDNCEQVISIENQGWIARWTTKDVPKTAS